MKEKANIQFGIAPIGWRNDDIPEIGIENTYKQILSDAKLAGFDGTEVGGCYPENPNELKKEIELRNTKIAGQWFSSYIIKDGIEKVIKEFEKHCEYLEIVNANIAVVSEQSYSIQGIEKCVFTDKPNFTDEEWVDLANGLNILGEIAQKYNLILAYHHHMGTGVQTLQEVDRLMANTDSSKVSLLYDTGHIYVSDGETLPLLNKYINRIAHVHFKDVRQSNLEECKKENRSFLDSFLHGMFTVPGDGIIDFISVYKVLIENDYKGWIVIEAEQDPKIANPLEYALLGKKYIENKLLAIN